jgi:hypothetical protein
VREPEGGRRRTAGVRTASAPPRPDASRPSAGARPRTWFGFAIAIGLVTAAIPFGIGLANRASHAAPAPATTSEDATVPDSWRRFTPADASFSVFAPDAGDATTVPSDVGPTHVVRFDEGAMSVAWTGRLPVSEDDAALLASDVSRLLEPLVGKVADAEEQLTDLGHPGFGLGLTLDGVAYRVRVFAAGGRLYEVLGKGPVGSEDAREAARFVESFSLR